MATEPGSKIWTKEAEKRKEVNIGKKPARLYNVVFVEMFYREENMKYIFLHGLGQSAHAWKAVAEGLCLKDTETPDIFTLSEDKLTYSSLYTAFEQYLSTFKEPLCLCGLSLGAVLALDYKIHHIEKVSALILAAPQYRVPTRLIDLQSFIFRLMPEKSFEAAGISKSDMITLTISMRKLDFSDKLHKVNCPTLLLCGEKDRANIKAASKLVHLLPDGTLCIIPGAGHEINISAPEACIETIRKFTSRLKS